MGSSDTDHWTEWVFAAFQTGDRISDGVEDRKFITVDDISTREVDDDQLGFEKSFKIYS